MGRSLLPQARALVAITALLGAAVPIAGEAQRANEGRPASAERPRASEALPVVDEALRARAALEAPGQRVRAIVQAVSLDLLQFHCSQNQQTD